ncbi:hypothetical protein E3Q24_02855 [Wallemia mellicola]|uniref:Saccharopine dehydrogenase NADP binding domain-containing protein n=1 Tax=Wallemia mellicola TaxID=1708541 RepID=A0AB38MTC5_9BASI|nr:hypothetical protein E3Q24_02855 [Wallemia mellicola]TIC25985.1 hypothetical protein E3Q12_00673 [Wallemia mellicola]TIC36743.1 hypothetical protein E3Q09_01179 [Wallemia mellicola]TIC56317.1 hypothetical protein E3Q04_01059 [Wallemia mellicola]TIC62910.1 hypothetical protein E3Q02_03273 [Wallemia mellicola]
MAEFDILVIGATEHHKDVKIALAARSLSKLDDVRQKLGVPSDVKSLTVPDLSTDSPELEEIVKAAKVVLSMAGPYALYGMSVATACVRAGVHFVDINGEGPSYYINLVKQLTYKASQTGSILVPSTGLDSLPSDIAVYKSVKGLRDNGIYSDINYSHTSFSGLIKGASGGTISSLLTMYDKTPKDQLRENRRDVWSLAPEVNSERAKLQNGEKLISYDNAVGKWGTPWLLGPHNIRVVYRSAALLPQLYSKTFKYTETLSHESFFRALLRGVMMALGGFLFATFPWFRALLQKVAPKSGTGPTPEQDAACSLVLDNTTKTVDGHEMHTRVTGKGHAGYSLTGIMSSEVALLLAKETPKKEGGVYTPASALGDVLIQELEKYGDFKFTTKLVK